MRLNQALQRVQGTSEERNHGIFLYNGTKTDVIISLLQVPWTRLAFLRYEVDRKVVGALGGLPLAQRAQRHPARHWYLCPTKWRNPLLFWPPRRSHGLPVPPPRPMFRYTQTWPTRHPIRLWSSWWNPTVKSFCPANWKEITRDYCCQERGNASLNLIHYWELLTDLHQFIWYTFKSIFFQYSEILYSNMRYTHHVF